MKRALVLAVLTAAFGLGCSDDDPSPIGPDVDPATTVHNFVASLSPANEVPPVTNAESGGTGTMNISIVLARNTSGVVTSAAVSFNGTFSGFPAGMSLTGAHIHPGVAGVNGGVVVNTGIASGDITLPNGSGSLTRSGITLSVDLANAIIANPSAYYFNIHTALNPGGVARGQLVAQ